MDNLAVIIPVYNEQDSIINVINKWVLELDRLQIDYNIFVYNDGSKDNTAKILEKISNENPKIITTNKENSGHGPTILKGYRDNTQNFTWLFQIDSDDEMGPENFSKLWEQRNNFDFLIGKRKERHQPTTRKIISSISRLTVRLFYGKGVYDVNSPFRLIRSEKFTELFNLIPEDTFAPNVLISGFVAKKKMKFFEFPIQYKPREFGEVSIKKIKLLKAAIKSFVQTITFGGKI